MSPSKEEETVLTELEKAKLMSCMESIKNIIGDTVPEAEVKKKIIQSNFDAEVALDLVLKESPPKAVTGMYIYYMYICKFLLSLYPNSNNKFLESPTGHKDNLELYSGM